MLINRCASDVIVKIIDDSGDIFKIGLGSEALAFSDTECEALAIKKYNEIKEREANPPEPSVDEKRKAEYIAKGLTPEKLIIVLWEKVVEGKSEEADKLQAERVKVKEKYPKTEN